MIPCDVSTVARRYLRRHLKPRRPRCRTLGTGGWRATRTYIMGKNAAATASVTSTTGGTPARKNTIVILHATTTTIMAESTIIGKKTMKASMVATLYPTLSMEPMGQLTRRSTWRGAGRRRDANECGCGESNGATDRRLHLSMCCRLTGTFLLSATMSLCPSSWHRLRSSRIWQIIC